MFEKVNPAHPDKVMDRIAGALVDYVYAHELNPRIAVEGMIGHGVCHIIAETSVRIPRDYIVRAVRNIAGPGILVNYMEVPQDANLARNQKGIVRCGDNGIFRGMPVTGEQRELTAVARRIYSAFLYDGKYILDGNHLIICQSNADADVLKAVYPGATVNPIGDWTGGPDVDTGARTCQRQT